MYYKENKYDCKTKIKLTLDLIKENNDILTKDDFYGDIYPNISTKAFILLDNDALSKEVLNDNDVLIDAFKYLDIESIQTLINARAVIDRQDIGLLRNAFGNDFITDTQEHKKLIKLVIKLIDKMDKDIIN